jgi:hypothetical protein
MPTSHRWVIFDPVTSQELVMFLNPSEMKLPAYEKNITVEETTAPNGRLILAEGVDQVKRMSWSGVTLELDQLDFLQSLYEKRYQVRLTDDFGRQWWVYPIKLEPSRSRAGRNFPERHQYSMEWIVLDWPS